METNLNNKIENDFMEYYFEEDILCSKFKCDLEMTINNLKQLIDLRHKISEGKKQYWCYNFNRLNGYTKEARDYAEIHGQDFLFACAVVVNSYITKFILNTFTKLKKAEIPLKAFTNQKDAIDWLKQLKAENEANGVF